MRPLARVATGGAVIAASALLLAALDGAVGRRLERSGTGSVTPSESALHAGAAAPRAVPGPLTAGPPIRGEAFVFRTRVGDLAVDDSVARRPGAHPRTLQGYRAIRAYPGAPPRVPHGLTPEEALGERCNNCHERGGYSPRFGAYVPVTPHPELRSCLQCHPTDAAVVGLALPDRRVDATCRQCHAPGARADGAPRLDWQAAGWPAVGGRRADGTPPEIPHDLLLRGDCVACHAGPAAVAELRTSHPERANCRQCHLVPFDLARSGGAP
jgi:nitrate reductase (cytochrome), electron transfer subunit